MTVLHMYIQSILAKPANILFDRKTCTVETCCDMYRLMHVDSLSPYLRRIPKQVMLHRFIPSVPASVANISYHKQICSAETRHIYRLTRVYNLFWDCRKFWHEANLYRVTPQPEYLMPPGNGCGDTAASFERTDLGPWYTATNFQIENVREVSGDKSSFEGTGDSWSLALSLCIQEAKRQNNIDVDWK